MPQRNGLSILDMVIFAVFFAVAVSVSMYKSRREETGEDFFWPAGD